MCGSIRIRSSNSFGRSFEYNVWPRQDRKQQESEEEFINTTKIVFKDDNNVRCEQEAMWTGYARVESLQDWLDRGWQKAAVVSCIGYTEKHQGTKRNNYYHVGQHRRLCVVINNKEFRVVTRSAKGMEKQVHNRWPVIVEQKS